MLLDSGPCYADTRDTTSGIDIEISSYKAGESITGKGEEDNSVCWMMMGAGIHSLQFSRIIIEFVCSIDSICMFIIVNEKPFSFGNPMEYISGICFGHYYYFISSNNR